MAKGVTSFSIDVKMSPDKSNNRICVSEELVAYLDDELDGESRARFESHLEQCVVCAAELNLQRRVLCELDVAFADDPGIEMPTNFAQIVAARARADFSGVREPHDRRRAFRLCTALAFLSVLLLGGAAASESVIAPLRAIWKTGVALFSFLAHALYDAGAGVAVISRGVGVRLLFESRPVGLLILLLFASAVFLLRRLIVRYHRAQPAG